MPFGWTVAERGRGSKPLCYVAGWLPSGSRSPPTGLAKEKGGSSGRGSVLAERKGRGLERIKFVCQLPRWSLCLPRRGAE